jgi:hypothetical protein
MKTLIKVNSFILVFGIIYLLLNYTIGQISWVNNTYLYESIKWKEIIFIFTSLVITTLLFNWDKKKENGNNYSAQQGV